MDRSLPGSSVYGVSEGRILEWVGISFFRASSAPRDQTYVSCTAGGIFTTELPGKPYQSVNTGTGDSGVGGRRGSPLSSCVSLDTLGPFSGPWLSFLKMEMTAVSSSVGSCEVEMGCCS